jgi:C1A family cysteine protease
MKKLLFLALLIFMSCDSNFDISQLNKEINTFDSDGDPIIENIQNTEEKSFGLENSYCYGFSTPTDQNIADIDLDINFPESFDISNFLPPVRSQGKQGSCVAWAAGYYLKSFQENFEDVNNGEIGLNNIMSPAFIFNQIKLANCNGSQIPKSLELTLNSGITSWDEMPYNENECDLQPTNEQINQAKTNKIESFYYLNGDILFDQTKAFLLKFQPVVIAISLDRQYFGAIDKNGEAVYRKFKKVDGAHALLIVGYDDSRNAFMAVNSWGQNWGNDGFVWIDYMAFKEVLDTNSDFKILCEAWVALDKIN